MSRAEGTMRTVCVALLACLAGCASYLPVSVEYNAATNFANYRSYGWLHEAAPPPMNPELYERLRTSLDRGLRARGYAPGDPSQFSIEMVLLARERMQVAGSGAHGGDFSYSDWGPTRLWSSLREENAAHLHQATLEVKIYDSATRELIWKGAVRKEIIPRDFAQPDIDQIVDAAMAQFPPDIRCTQIASRYEPCGY